MIGGTSSQTKAEHVWMKPGVFAEYSANEVTWLLVASNVTEVGVLSRNNDSRFISLNQSAEARFKWTILSINNNEVQLELSLDFPLPLGNITTPIFVNSESREMFQSGVQLGKNPFWMFEQPSEGTELIIGASPESIRYFVGETGSYTNTIQGDQRHFYVHPELDGFPLDYEWDTGLLLVILLEPIINNSLNQMSCCFQPFYSLGLHGCNRLFRLSSTNIDLGPEYTSYFVSPNAILPLVVIVTFLLICGLFSFLYYKRNLKRKRYKVKKRRKVSKNR